MSWLLFMDESGYDHRTMPYEVRGGVALRADRLWPFVQDMQRLEVDCFGARVYRYRKELKGCKLLDRDRIRWARQAGPQPDEARRKNSLSFLHKGLHQQKPTRDEFTAYGQACLNMALGIFESLRNHQGTLFAAAIPRKCDKPKTFEAEEYLRKDFVFVLERYFYFLDQQREPGLLIMDETEAVNDRRFIRRLEAYFTKTQTGRQRTKWIVPTPFFVSSDMTYPIQAADVCIYCLNWGFRLPRQGMNAKTRDDIAELFSPWLERMQYHSEIRQGNNVFNTYGIVYVPDPYTPR